MDPRGFILGSLGAQLLHIAPKVSFASGCSGGTESPLGPEDPAKAPQGAPWGQRKRQPSPFSPFAYAAPTRTPQPGRLCSRQTPAPTGGMRVTREGRARCCTRRGCLFLAHLLAGTLQTKTRLLLLADAVISPHQAWELVSFPGSHLSMARCGGGPWAGGCVSIIFDGPSYGA